MPPEPSSRRMVYPAMVVPAGTDMRGWYRRPDGPCSIGRPGLPFGLSEFSTNLGYIVRARLRLRRRYCATVDPRRSPRGTTHAHETSLGQGPRRAVLRSER